MSNSTSRASSASGPSHSTTVGHGPCCYARPVATDAELLAAWRVGDNDAGNALVKRHFAAVYRFFRNKIDGDLDELVQATFVRCTDRVDAIVSNEHFRGFLFGIARNVLKEHFREKVRRRESIDFHITSVADLGTSPTGHSRAGSTIVSCSPRCGRFHSRTKSRSSSCTGKT